MLWPIPGEAAQNYTWHFIWPVRALVQTCLVNVGAHYLVNVSFSVSHVVTPDVVLFHMLYISLTEKNVFLKTRLVD